MKLRKLIQQLKSACINGGNSSLNLHKIEDIENDIDKELLDLFYECPECGDHFRVDNKGCYLCDYSKEK